MKKICIISIIIYLCFSSCIGEETDDNIMSVYIKNDTSYILSINNTTINTGDSIRLTTKNFSPSVSSDKILQTYLYYDVPDTIIIRRNTVNDDTVMYLKSDRNKSDKNFYNINYWFIYEYAKLGDEKRYCIFNINDNDFTQ